MLKILIADSSDDFVSSLARLMEGKYHVRTAADGLEAVKELRVFRPDVVVLDLMLGRIDGADLLKIGASYGLKPVTLALTRYQSDYLQGLAEQLHVDYVMMRPCSAPAVFRKLEDVLGFHSSTGVRTTTPEENLTMALDVLGLLETHEGYRHIIQSVLILEKDPTQSITKIVYPEVAAAFGGNGVQVERAIRLAIQHAWKRRDEQVWRCYFRADASGALPKPTNQTFILMLVRLLKYWRKAYEKSCIF